MPFGVARLGDVDSEGAPQVQGSTNVFANNLAVCRTGDLDSGAGPDNPPGAAIGQSTVFVNGLPIYVIGNPDSSGRTQIEGSLNVFANP